jgi:hypothetical protein
VRSLAARDVVSLRGRPKLTQTVEGCHAIKSHVLVRFGRWQDIIDELIVGEPELYVLTTAMQHYAKGVAHATLRDFAEAERERERFHQCVGAARASGMPGTPRRERGAARVAGQAGHCASQGGCADQLVVPVQDQRAI